MGKNQKIPYLNEVIFYIVKVIAIFFILDYLIAKTSFYDPSIILIVAIFFSFSYNPFYLLLVAVSYPISFGISTAKIGDLGILFLYLFTVLLNTFFMIVYLKFKYNFKETE